MSTSLKLRNHVSMPQLGFGVFQTPPEATIAAVTEALRVGYRLIDTAAAYGNEREVGEAIRRSGINRDEIFLETKVWISDYGYHETLHAFEKSASKLGVNQIDLLLLHQPLPTAFDRTLEAYRALETLYNEGKVRAIGVSNFGPDELHRVLEVATVTPMVNQIEIHPYFTQHDLQLIDREHHIVNQAWSPLGGITYYRDSDLPSTLENQVLAEIAARHGKSPAQVMLRWHLQQGRSAIPKSVNPIRIAENFDVFDFELSESDLAAIDALDTGRRGGPDPTSITLETTFSIPEA